MGQVEAAEEEEELPAKEVISSIIGRHNSTCNLILPLFPTYLSSIF